jgi:two-component system response regulator GlrR
MKSQHNRSVPPESSREKLFTLFDEPGYESRIPIYHIKLTVIEGRDKDRSCEVVSTHVTIGSSSTNDLQLRDRLVSRHHFQIVARHRYYLLRDLGSGNGTFVNGLRIIEGIIESGATISVGSDKIRFEPRRDWTVVSLSNRADFGDLKGRSNAMARVFGLLEEVARSALSCLLVGEAGSGKTLAARAIHAHSDRSDKPFVAVDCARVGSTMLEDRLFGHQRDELGGDDERVGAIEEANGGILFLDNIGTIPFALQRKLLRALERKKARRIGARSSIKLDLRVIAATRPSFAAMLSEGIYNKYLYYRMAEVIIYIPPLRERLSDLEVLAQDILERDGQETVVLSADARKFLTERDWPGNVEELRLLLVRAARLAATDVIDRRLLEEMIVANSITATMAENNTPENADLIGTELSINDATEAYRQAYLQNVKDRYGDDIQRAAYHIGVPLSAVTDLYRRYGVS